MQFPGVVRCSGGSIGRVEQQHGIISTRLCGRFLQFVHWFHFSPSLLLLRIPVVPHYGKCETRYREIKDEKRFFVGRRMHTAAILRI